jgi:hypothetical protein
LATPSTLAILSAENPLVFERISGVEGFLPLNQNFKPEFFDGIDPGILAAPRDSNLSR